MDILSILPFRRSSHEVSARTHAPLSSEALEALASFYSGVTIYKAEREESSFRVPWLAYATLDTLQKINKSDTETKAVSVTRERLDNASDLEKILMQDEKAYALLSSYIVSSRSSGSTEKHIPFPSAATLNAIEDAALGPFFVTGSAPWLDHPNTVAYARPETVAPELKRGISSLVERILQLTPHDFKEYKPTNPQDESMAFHIRNLEYASNNKNGRALIEEIGNELVARQMLRMGEKLLDAQDEIRQLRDAAPNARVQKRERPICLYGNNCG